MYYVTHSIWKIDTFRNLSIFYNTMKRYIFCGKNYGFYIYKVV